MALPPLGEWNPGDDLAEEVTRNRGPVLASPFPQGVAVAAVTVPYSHSVPVG